MRPVALTMMVFLSCAGCTQRQSDLEQARTTRSILAEWALLEELRSGLPAIYVQQMREGARHELGKIRKVARNAHTPAAAGTAAAADVPDVPSSVLLQARARAAQAIGDRLEAR